MEPMWPDRREHRDQLLVLDQLHHPGSSSRRSSKRRFSGPLRAPPTTPADSQEQPAHFSGYI